MLNKESNAYTLGYAAIMTVVVAVVLTTLFTALKPMHDANEQLAKKKDILKAVGLVDLEDPEKSYEDNIVGYILDHEGNDITDADTSVVPETVDVGKESKLAEDKRKYPIFIYTAEDGGKKYIVPLHGKGLWDKIWGYIAINDDFNTIYGISFDHKAETPGLGAEMKDNPKEYNEPFIGKKLFKGEAFKSE